MDKFGLKKLKAIGNTIKTDAYLEIHSGLPKKFKVVGLKAPVIKSPKVKLRI